MIINVTIEDRSDGGVSVTSEDLAGLVLSGKNRVAIIKAIEPAARAILEHKGLDASNIRIDATFIKPSNCTVCHQAPGIWHSRTRPDYFACDDCVVKDLADSSGIREGK